MEELLAIEPLFARVLLKREKLKNKSLLIPDDVAIRNASLRCVVLALGPNADESINVGDDVIIGKFAGTWLDEDGKAVSDGEYFIVADEDILARVT